MWKTEKDEKFRRTGFSVIHSRDGRKYLAALCKCKAMLNADTPGYASPSTIDASRKVKSCP